MNSGRVILLGSKPPPFTGQSSYYLYLKDRMKDFDLWDLSTKTRDPADGALGYARRAGGIIWTATKILFAKRANAVFMVLDSGHGLIFNVILLMALQIRRPNHLAMSHHSFKSIDQPTSLMRLVVRFGSRLGGKHLFLCKAMETRFEGIYGNGRRLGLVLGNARRVDASAFTPCRKDGAFTLGYLSNITFEKGIREYFSLLDAVIARGGNVHGLVAGPAEPEVAAYVSEQIDRLGGRARWIGPVYGAEKLDFFRKIDLLVFPTKYVNEAQPNVLLEALAAGVPVVSLDRGCIASDMAGSGSLLVDDPNRFLELATPFVEAALAQKARNAGGAEASNRARLRFVELAAEARAAEETLFKSWITQATI